MKIGAVMNWYMHALIFELQIHFTLMKNALISFEHGFWTVDAKSRSKPAKTRYCCKRNLYRLTIVLFQSL